MTRSGAPDPESSHATISALGQKIGIPNLAVEDFDLIYASAKGVGAYCDQFEAIALTQDERFYLMQLIVASLDLALRRSTSEVRASQRRVEDLIKADLPSYKYIIDYWGKWDGPWRVTRMMRKLKRDPRYVYEGGRAMFEDPPERHLRRRGRRRVVPACS